MSKSKKIILSSIIAFIGVGTLPEMMGFQQEQLYLTNSIFSFMLWLGIAILIDAGWKYAKWNDIRETVIIAAFSIIFAGCMATGAALDSTEYITFGNWKRLSDIIGFALAATTINKEIIGYFWGAVSQKDIEYKDRGYSTSQYVCIMTGLLICWIPVFLAVYPGFFVYDAGDELNEVLTRTLTTHHPLLHVLALGGIVAAVHKISGSYNWGIACYTCLQMIFVSWIFTYMMSFLKKHHVKKKIRICTFIFLGVFPVIPMYVLCSSKDTLFTAALLLVILFTYEMLTDEELFCKNRKIQILFVIFSFVMMNLRNNGVYAFVVWIPFVVWRVYKRKSKYLKRIILLFIVPVLLYLLFSKILVCVLNADNSEKQEMLTVPIMQIARTYQTDKDYFKEEDKEILFTYLPEEALDKYTPKLSDNVKVYFNNVEYTGNPLGFWKLWLKTGISHAGTYINAWLYTSYGFWYPDTVIDVYSGIQRYTFTYGESTYFGYETELPGIRESKIPWLNEIYRKLSLEITQQKIPVISMLFSPGFMFWIYAFAEMLFAIHRKYNKMLIFGITIFLWMTVLLGPTYMVRYVLIFWFALPVLLSMLFDRQTGFA